MAMGNFGILFRTHGYQKTHQEMSSIENKAKAVRTGFMRVGPEATTAGSMVSRGLGLMRAGLTAIMVPLRMFYSLTSIVSKAILGLGAAVGAVGVALATKFALGLMKTREGFYLIETAMTGVVKNAATVTKISDWAMMYAAKYPAMYEDVMEAMKGLSMMPALKPIFTKAAVEDMEKIMNIVQGLAALDPQQGVRGALYAIREALAGQWRTLMYRFEIRPEAVAAAAGLSFEELKKSPEAAIKALDAFIKLNVGADTLRKTAQSLGIQWGNLIDKYKIWLNTVAQYGAYQRLVDFLMWLNELWDRILKSKGAERLGQEISRIFEGITSGLQSILTRGIDWERGGIFNSLIQAGRNAMESLKTIFLDAKEMLSASMRVTISLIAKGLLLFVKEVFIPVGKEIASAIAGAFSEAIKAKGRQMKQDVKDVFVEPVKEAAKKGPGGIWEGMKKEFDERMLKPWRKFFGGEKGEAERLEKEISYPEWLLGKREPGKPVPVAEEEPVGVLDKATKTAMEQLKEATAGFWAKISARLPAAGMASAARELTEIEEQRNMILEKRYQLRLMEATGTQKQIDMAREELAYAEKMLRYHEAKAKWEADPTGGVRLEEVKQRMLELNNVRMDSIKIGKQNEEVEKELLALAKERQELETRRAEAIPGIERYSQEELNALIDQEVEKKKESAKITGRIRDLEAEIAGLKRAEEPAIDQIVEAELELEGLREKVAAQIKAVQKLRANEYKVWLEQHGTAVDGIKAGLDEIQNYFTSTFQQARRAAIITADAMRQAFSDFFFDVMTRQFESWKDYLRSFLRDIARAVSASLSGQIVGWAGTALSGWLGGGTTGGQVQTWVTHKGYPSLPPTRVVHETVFAGATRAHMGLKPGERPVIMRDDEFVFTPEQMKALGRGQEEVLKRSKEDREKGAGQVIHNQITIQAVDAKSFVEMCQRNPQGIIGAVSQAITSNTGLRHTIKAYAR